MEGSYSSARAITQLRQFYLQMVDKQDELLMQMNWMQRWISYQDKVNSQADEPTPVVREGSR